MSEESSRRDAAQSGDCTRRFGRARKERNFLQQQARFDAFIDCCNRERPHQALQMRYPAELYRPSITPYRGLHSGQSPDALWMRESPAWVPWSGASCADRVGAAAGIGSIRTVRTEIVDDWTLPPMQLLAVFATDDGQARKLAHSSPSSKSGSWSVSRRRRALTKRPLRGVAKGSDEGARSRSATWLG